MDFVAVLGIQIDCVPGFAALSVVYAAITLMYRKFLEEVAAVPVVWITMDLYAAVASAIQPIEPMLDKDLGLKAPHVGIGAQLFGVGF